MWQFELRLSELHDLLSRDHDRLDALLVEGSYEAFRAGLLRHIAIEEKLLFPMIRARSQKLDLLEQLHRDHAALAALLVPPPSPDLLAVIADILSKHNPLEEDAGGLYDVAESIASDVLNKLVEAAERMPAVALAPHADTVVTRNSIRQLVREAEEGRRRLARY